MANTAESAIFCFFAICKFYIPIRGGRNIEKSEMTFTAALIMKEEFMSTQWPVVSGFQIFSLGMHSKITTNVSAP